VKLDAIWNSRFLYFSSMLQKAGFFFLLFIALSSCSKVVEDNEDPVLTAFEINSKSFQPGETITVNVSGRDNENLGQLRLRIEEAFDKSSFGFWRVVEIQDISGQSVSRALNFTVPDSSLAGYYSVAVQLSDLRGNASIDSVQYIAIRQEGIMPQIQDFATNPEFDESGLILLDDEDTLTFSGLAMGDTLLSEVQIELLSNEGIRMERFTYDLLDDSTNVWDFTTNADSIFTDFTSNPETLIIRVTDVVGHLDRREFTVEFGQ